MKIAIEGCAHGELEKIYDSIAHLEQKEDIKVDLLICCGDFQSTRNIQDLLCMAVPTKYMQMCSFYKYYSGEKVAPILTLFIGGNHEASNYLSELSYGGWVAPNIYFLGYAGVVQVGGIRIAGISGIYKGNDYMKGHFEIPPYTESTKRSVYHVRNLDVFRLKQLSQPVDIVISHDWPRGIYHHGNVSQLLKSKPFFEEEVRNNTLGSMPAQELLLHLKPSYWFSAHLHCKFAALVPHLSEDEKSDRATKFLALDKCLPRRRFLQIVDVPHNESKPIEVEYDLEWLSILHLTNHLMSIKNSLNYMPGLGGDGRWNFTPTDEEKQFVLQRFSGDLKVPNNFAPTVTPFSINMSTRLSGVPSAKAQLNPQTMAFCDRLGIDDPMALLLKRDGHKVNQSTSPSYSEGGVFLQLPENCPEQSSSNGEDEPQSSPPQSASSEPSSLSPSKPVNRLSGLVLPAPAHFDNNSADGTEADSSSTEAVTSHPNVENEQAPEELFYESRTPSTVDTAPQRKKFKRRNEALYAPCDDDS